MTCKRRPSSVSPDQITSILLIKLGAFGDMVFADGVMRLIRSHYKNAQITLLTEPFYAKLWANAPYIDGTMQDKRDSRFNLMAMRRLKKQLIERKFDLVIDLQNSPRSCQYRGWLKNSILCGKQDPADYVYQQDVHKAQSVADVLAEQIALLDIPTENNYEPDMHWLGKAAQETHALSECANSIQEKSILLVPGASARNADKRWPHFAALINLLTEHGWHCYTAPGPDEIDLCASLPCTSLLLDGKPLTFAELAMISQRFAYVVGNDTGPSHLVAACQRPSLILLGARGQPDRIRMNNMMHFLQTEDISGLSPEEVFADLMDRLPQ